MPYQESLQPVYYPTLESILKPRFARMTNRLACLYFEWFGGYSWSTEYRLLGHYRLYQHFKRWYHPTNWLLPPTQAYILHYRSLHSLKFFFMQCFNIYVSAKTTGLPIGIAATENINRTLLHNHPEILAKFLEDATTDLQSAITAITDPSFLGLAAPSPPHPPLPDPEPAAATPQEPEPTVQKGKQKDVFSKKQTLILIDILSEAEVLDKIDLRNPNKYTNIAAFLYAITGKTTNAWTQELNNHRDGNFYKYHSDGEYKQLLSCMTNMADIFEKAGKEKLAHLITQKRNQLEKKHK